MKQNEEHPRVEVDDDTEVHLSHCNQGEYLGGCKYGEIETCPANKPRAEVKEYEDEMLAAFERGYNAALKNNKQAKVKEKRRYTYTAEELQNLLIDFVGFNHPYDEPRGSIAKRFIESLTKT